MKTIGFVGTGTMGKGMVQNLLKNNFAVKAYNRTKQRLEGLQHANLTIVDSPQEAATGVDIVFTIVTNDAAVEEVMLGEKGMLQDIAAGTVVVDSSTTSIELTEKIAAVCKEKNVEFLDAPVTGSKTGAETGTLMFMIGGKEEVFEKARPVFEAMGKKLVYCGESTYGQRVKIALNLTQALVFQSYLEGIMLAVKNGVPLAIMKDVLDNSGAKSNVATGKMPSLLKRDFTPHFMVKLMHKDMNLAKKEMEKLNLPLPLSSQILSVFEKAMEKELAEKDWSAIVEVIEEQAGIQLREA